MRKFRFKEILVFSMVICIASVLPITAFAEEGQSTNASTTANMENDTNNELSELIALSIGKNSALVAGKNKEIDSSNSNIAPFIENGRTYVPLRFVSESLGLTVNWISETNTVEIKSNDTIVQIIVGQKYMTVNGTVKEMDVAAIIKDGRTYVPIRYITEAFGKNILYENGLIVISPSNVKLDSSTNKSLIAHIKDRFSKPKDKNNGVEKGSEEPKMEKPDLSGKIQSISDASVTLNIIDTTSNEQRPKDMDNKNDKSSTDTQGTSQDSSKPKLPQNEGTSEKHELTYTGDTKTITIKSSTVINSMTMTDSGMQTSTLTVNDLKVDDVIDVFYDSSDNSLISKIIVRPQMQKQ
jgi:hypothetical protein